MMLTAITAALSALTLGSYQADGLNLALQCDGFADADATTFINRQDGSAPTIVSGSTRTGERIVIVFEGSAGRIRMPPALEPNIRGRSDDGWRPLSDIQVAEDQITSRFSFNFFDKPSVRIDRVSGMLDVRGLAFRFQGECSPYDAQARRF